MIKEGKIPAEEQIYLEKAWKLDEEGRFIECAERTQGIIIFGREMVAIEFFTQEDGMHDRANDELE